MIHDLFLSLLNPYSKRLPIEDFLESSDFAALIHPQEKQFLIQILDIIYLHREIIKFIKVYGSNHIHLMDKVVDTDEPLQKGLYLKAFANALEVVLEPYVKEIVLLEQRYLQNCSSGLIFIYQKVNDYKPLFMYLQGTIKSIKLQKLHGCVIIQYLHRHSLHGDKKIAIALKQILKIINIVFLKQFTEWIFYAKINDMYGEFFIQPIDAENTINCLSNEDRCTSSGSGRHTTFSTVSDTTSNYTDIWRYEIYYGMLPNYFSSSLAEKVLFIGQTVLMFTGQSNKNNFNKKSEFWNAENVTKKMDVSLWNGQEHVFFKQIQKLNESDINVADYEKFVDGVKSFISERLSEISVNQADLVHQLKLVKEFYMLGRGELFLEFIKKTHDISKTLVSENSVRRILKAYELAALSVGVVDELEKFTLTIPKPVFEDENNEDGFIQQVVLNYKITWPLQLLFSPLMLERYNTIFRFLLQIKQTQYELDMVWNKQRTEYKADRNKTNISISLRNQLMFFIHNLQYYIQVDVIETQFSILMKNVSSTNDFEELTRSHNVFQTNILSLCFLLKTEDMRKSMTIGANNNLVILILNDIFHLCSDFCKLLEYTSDKDVLKTEINLLEDKFKELIEQLINILVGYKLTSNLTRAPLSQLLLRLDFNNWLSNTNQKEII